MNLIPVILKELGLEENEEFYVKFNDGTVGKYRCWINNNGLECERNIIKEYVFTIILNGTISIAKIKKISEDEKVILRNLPKEYKWIARDKSDSLYVYKNKPIKNEEGYWEVDKNYEHIDLFKHLFRCIKWEDEEPTLIEDLLKE